MLAHLLISLALINGTGGSVALYWVRRRLAHVGQQPSYRLWCGWIALECVITLCLMAAVAMLV